MSTTPEYLKSYKLAHLIPVATKPEPRIVGSTLATLSSVKEFAKALLDSIDAPLSKTSKIECYTEVVFKPKDKKTIGRLRPDGLIVITTGKRQWRALVEAKISDAELDSQQIESYLDIAKDHEIDAVVTISNQLAITPSHHPNSIKKTKLRKVDLYHWSWTYIEAKARMLVNNKNISDPVQSYLLSELVRFFEHKNSGIMPYANMGSSWKEICESIQNGKRIKKDNNNVRDCVASWHQFIRNNAIIQSLELEKGGDVDIYLPLAHRKNPEQRIQDDADKLVKDKMLVAEFIVPNAARRITYTARINTQQVTISMTLLAPTDIPTAKGRINWLLRQLKKAKDDGSNRSNSEIFIRVTRPKKMDAKPSLEKILQEGYELLMTDDPSTVPKEFEIELIKNFRDSTFTGGNFVREAKPLLPIFYSKVGQHVKAWVAPPRRVRAKNKEQSHTTVSTTKEADKGTA